MIPVNPQHFKIYEHNEKIIIHVASHSFFSRIILYLDDLHVKTTPSKQEIIIDKKKIPKGTHLLHVIGEYHHQGLPYTIQESFSITITKKKYKKEYREQTFKPGDILVASDNVIGVPNGYIGHAALVIDEHSILESTNIHESISINPIDKFIRNHDWYAHYRPKDAVMGEKAVRWGLVYYEKYKENVAEGLNQPKFSFMPSFNMKEIWNTIYCSKLVWFCLAA